MKLHEISANHNELALLVENEELTQEQVSDTMDLIDGEFNDKAASIIAVKDNMQANVTAIDAELKRLQDRKKHIQNKQAALIDYLRFNMEATGIKKIECPLFTISCVAGRDMIDVIDAEVIPDSYQKVKTSIAPDKAEILVDLKKGIEISGVRLGKTKSSIRIK